MSRVVLNVAALFIVCYDNCMVQTSFHTATRHSIQAKPKHPCFCRTLRGNIISPLPHVYSQRYNFHDHIPQNHTCDISGLSPDSIAKCWPYVYAGELCALPTSHTHTVKINPNADIKPQSHTYWYMVGSLTIMSPQVICVSTLILMLPNCCVGQYMMKPVYFPDSKTDLKSAI